MIKDLPSQSISPGELSFLCRQPTMSRTCTALPEPLMRTRRPTSQSCHCLDLKTLPHPKKPLNPTDTAWWALNLQGMGAGEGGTTDGTLKHYMLMRSVWTGQCNLALIEQCQWPWDMGHTRFDGPQSTLGWVRHKRE